MHISRRKFLKTSAGVATLLSSPQVLMSCVSDRKTLKDFGLQLYTLRDVMPKDPKGVLKQVADMGYTQVESFEGSQGMFWNMTNLEFKKLMDDLGMKIVSSHTNIHKDFERKVNEAAEIGMAYLIDPYEGSNKTIDDFKRLADVFNESGRICKEHGIRFAYHNHAYSFRKTDGQFPQDVLMQNTDPGLVDYEMDIYWVVTAGENPIEWFEKYPNRWKLGHLKDRRKNAAASDQDATTVLGTGSIDWKTLLKSAVNHGMEYFLVEQEQYENMSSEEAARQNAQFLKQLKF